jgi:CRP-like cAMP-binding protein
MPLFAGFSVDQRRQIAASLSLVLLDENQLVYQDGEAYTGIAVVMGGKLCVNHSKANPLTPLPRAMRSGSVFGDDVLVAPNAKAPEIKAGRKSVLAFIRTAQFLEAIRCASPYRALEHDGVALSKQLLTSAVADRSDQDLDRLVSLTRCLSFFQQVSQMKVHEALLREAEFQEFSSGVPIFKEGDKPDKVYVIVQGSATAVGCGMGAAKTPAFIDVLFPGQCFGDCSVSLNIPRTATIYPTGGPCQCITIKKMHFERLLKHHVDTIKQKVAMLKNLGPLAQWKLPMLARIAYFFQLRHFRKNEVVMRQGDAAESLFLVCSGEFKVRKLIGTPGGLGQRSTIAAITPRPGSAKERPRSAGPSRSSHTVGTQKNGQRIVDLNTLGVAGVLGDVELLGSGEGICESSVLCNSHSGSTMELKRTHLLNRLGDEALSALRDDAEMKEEWRSERLAAAQAALPRPQTAALLSSFQLGATLDKSEWGSAALGAPPTSLLTKGLSLPSDKPVLGPVRKSSETMSTTSNVAAVTLDGFEVAVKSDAAPTKVEKQEDSPKSDRPSSSDAHSTQDTTRCADDQEQVLSDIDDDDYFGADSEDEDDERPRTAPCPPNEEEKLSLSLTMHPRMHYIRPSSAQGSRPSSSQSSLKPAQ